MSIQEERLAGMMLEELRDQYRYDLFEDFLPFMDRYVIDHELGGFRCETDRDGANLTQNKTTWFEGRGIWVYSFLYDNFGRDPRYLEVARKSVEFVLKAQPRGEDELWPRSFSREGRPLTPPATELYGDLFIAEGLAEYSKATGEEKYRDLAREIVLKCVRIYDRPDHNPEIGQAHLGTKSVAFPGARIQGAWMVLIRILSQMLEARADPELEDIIARAIDAVMNYHYNPEFGLNNELLNHDLSRPAGEYAQLVYTGHSIEALWMILYEALRRKDQALFDTAAERFRRHVEVTWDDVYGGVFHVLRNVDQNIWSLEKVLWAQAEVLIGCLFLFEHTGDPWARDMFGKMYTYVREKFPLKRHGYALWMHQGDRKVTFERHSTRVENYHHPRHLMLNLLSIQRMMDETGH
jgi:mannose/cellobiose epimerase-like protein (N-acyl-D-glucosamine 2-epimerase family)